MRSLLRRLKAPPRLPKKMNRITSPECPSPWMKHQRSKPFPFTFGVPRSYLQGELLGRSWICSYQATPRTSRRSPLGDDTNLQHLLGYSLVAGSPLQNLLEMKVVRRWRKLPGSSSFQDHLWLRMSLPLRRLPRMYRLRLLPQLRRRQRKTRSGGCARSCEGLLDPCIRLPITHERARLLSHLEGRIHSLPFSVHMAFLYDARYAFTTHIFPILLTSMNPTL